MAVLEWLPPHPEFLLLVVLAGTAIAWWIGQCAHLWATAGRTTLPVMAAVLGAAWLALSSWFIWWQSDGTLYTLGTMVDTGQVREVLAHGLGGPAADHALVLSAFASFFPLMHGMSIPALSVASMIALWIVPLPAWIVRPADGTPRWLRRLSTTRVRSWSARHPCRRCAGRCCPAWPAVSWRVPRWWGCRPTCTRGARCLRDRARCSR
ncbi:hypothetical protein GCM10022267_77650 [Lentzea roselyniae]|uniref:Uncharacterized protein n=1 Tax=Lentzea roselyniae TaxID=531940 RepID=A0ABP7C8U4_9PSEU